MKSVIKVSELLENWINVKPCPKSHKGWRTYGVREIEFAQGWSRYNIGFTESVLDIDYTDENGYRIHASHVGRMNKHVGGVSVAKIAVHVNDSRLLHLEKRLQKIMREKGFKLYKTTKVSEDLYINYYKNY